MAALVSDECRLRFRPSNCLQMNPKVMVIADLFSRDLPQTLLRDPVGRSTILYAMKLCILFRLSKLCGYHQRKRKVIGLLLVLSSLQSPCSPGASLVD